jgi:hypothetical protein
MVTIGESESISEHKLFFGDCIFAQSATGLAPLAASSAAPIFRVLLFH